MRLSNLFVFLIVGFVVASCASDRATWALGHSYMSPRARRLPSAELKEIVGLVSAAWPNIITGVGQACGDPPDVMHVVAEYTDSQVMVFDLKRRSGHWYISDRGEGTPFISRSWYEC
jgi:hypothetical protein